MQLSSSQSCKRRKSSTTANYKSVQLPLNYLQASLLDGRSGFSFTLTCFLSFLKSSEQRVPKSYG